ncbi:MAG: hypothetical protein LBN07_00475 [Christensenellaceae bacterium]|jgi:hypothetical protein|nr:hypothetical protein [Christensenellaceae bacterium]
MRESLKKKLIAEDYAPPKKEFKNDQSAATLWGKVVLKLRESKYPVLHTACGDIRKTQLEGNILRVFIETEYIYNIIVKEENFALLTKTVEQINPGLVVSLQFVEDKTADENALKLKRKFGEKLDVEE